MYIEIDLSVVPPRVQLREPDDFKAFSVAVIEPEHAWVGPDALRELAGDRASDPKWLEQLDGMLAFAASKGWVREDGAVRAHLARG
jgi:hypothetical protein